MNQIVEKQITINAPASKVWKALTTASLTKKYFFKSEVYSTWEIGSPIVFKRKILFFTFKLEGTIKQCEPEKLLQYTLLKHKFFGKSDPHNFSIVTDTLTEHDGKTTVSITDDVGKEPGTEKRYTRSVKGWDKILSGLKELLEK